MAPLKKNSLLKPKNTKTTSVTKQKKVPICATKSNSKTKFNDILSTVLGSVGEQITQMLSEPEHTNVDVPTTRLVGGQKKILQDSTKKKKNGNYTKKVEPIHKIFEAINETNIETDPKPKKGVSGRNKIHKDSKIKKGDPDQKLFEAMSETNVQTNPKPEKRVSGRNKIHKDSKIKKGDPDQKLFEAMSEANVQTDPKPEKRVGAQKKILKDSKKKKNNRFEKIEPIHPNLFDAMWKTIVPTVITPKKKIIWEPFVLNTSIEVQNQNILNVNSKRSYDSELDHIVNDLHFKVEFVDDNKEEVEEIIEVEETDTSYMLHLSLDQTLNLQKGGSLFMKKGLIPLDFKVTKLFDKVDHSPNREISKDDLRDTVDSINSNSKEGLQNCTTTAKNEQINQLTDKSESKNQFVINPSAPTQQLFRGLNTTYLTKTKTLTNGIDGNLPSSTIPKLINQGDTSVITKSLKNDGKNLSTSKTKKSASPSRANNDVQNITNATLMTIEDPRNSTEDGFPVTGKEQGDTSVIIKRLKKNNKNLTILQTKKSASTSQVKKDVQHITDAKLMTIEDTRNSTEDGFPVTGKEQGDTSVIIKRLKKNNKNLTILQTKKSASTSQVKKDVQHITDAKLMTIEDTRNSTEDGFPVIGKEQGDTSVIIKRLKKNNKNLSISQTKKSASTSRANNDVQNITNATLMTIEDPRNSTEDGFPVTGKEQGDTSVVTKRLKKDSKNLSKLQTKISASTSQGKKDVQHITDANLMTIEDTRNSTEDGFPVTGKEQGDTSVIIKRLKKNNKNLSISQTNKRDSPFQANNEVQIIPYTTLMSIEEPCNSTEDGFPVTGKEQGNTIVESGHEQLNQSNDLLNEKIDENVLLQIQKIDDEELTDNEIVSEEVNTVSDYSIVTENDPIDKNNPQRWLIDVLRTTKVKTVQKVTRI